MSFEFSTTWLSAPSVIDPAEAATWAEISLRAGEVLLSELHDIHTSVVRPGFFASALPLAEWVAANWFRLLHERREPRTEDERWEWRDAHALRVGRQGYPVPNLTLRRASDAEFELLALADGMDLGPGMTTRFLNSGRFRLDARQVETGLNRFLDGVLARLGPLSGPRIENFRDAHSQRAAQRERILEARLGVSRDELRSLRLSELEVALAEGSLASTPSLRIEEARVYSALLVAPIPEPTTRWERLERELGEVHPSQSRPWRTGWDAAWKFREAAGLEHSQSLASARSHIERVTGWNLQVNFEAGLGEIDTVHQRNPHGPPLVTTRVKNTQGQMFRAARSLYHGLFGGSDAVVVDSPALKSRLSTANAFAAELVAPVSRLQAMLPATGVWSEESIESVARQLEVQKQVVIHQIENHDELGSLSVEMS